MQKEEWNRIQAHMLAHVEPGDSAHDAQHVLRVTRTALELMRAYPEADEEVLTAAALLHDIGRGAQFRSGKNHAEAGAHMAEAYLRSIGWAEERAAHVADCIRTHRYRSNQPPVSIEAQILYDADKLDAAGAIGIARTLLYCGKVGDPLCAFSAGGEMDVRAKDSFMGEYNRKLTQLYDRFCTPEAAALARKRQAAAERFYEDLLAEMTGEKGERR